MEKVEYINYTINWAIAPHTWDKFQEWWKAACPDDPLTCKERFLKEGGVIHDDSGVKDKK